jgi:hypothetical protein
MTEVDTSIASILKPSLSGLDIDDQPIQRYFKEIPYEPILRMMSQLQTGVIKAQEEGVPDARIQTRLYQVLEGGSLVRGLYRDREIKIPSPVTEEWIDQKLSLVKKPAFSDDEAMRRVHHDLFRVLGDKNTSAKETVATFVNTVIHDENPLYYLGYFLRMVPRPVTQDEPRVLFWDETAGGALPIAISGREASGVSGLRPYIHEMQSLRAAYWPSQNRQEIVCDSWMFARSENVEKMLGESMEALEAKGLSWVGDIDILNSDDLSRDHLGKTTNPQQLIASAVYALPLRESFVTNFLSKGIYPTMGAFRMPRATFQNWNGK